MGFDISCKLSPLIWNVKSCFLRKIRKIFQYVICWKLFPACLRLKNQKVKPSLLQCCIDSSKWSLWLWYFMQFVSYETNAQKVKTYFLGKIGKFFNMSSEFFIQHAKLEPLKCQENLHLKMSSVYVVCWIFLQTFQTCICIQTNSVDSDQTAPAKMTFKIMSRWQSRHFDWQFKG